MRQVEAGAAGVVWGIGFDGISYSFTGGYGGGIFSGFASSVHGIHQQEDSDWHYIYENQRWNPLEGYSDRLVDARHCCDFAVDWFYWLDDLLVY